MIGLSFLGIEKPGRLAGFFIGEHQMEFAVSFMMVIENSGANAEHQVCLFSEMER